LGLERFSKKYNVGLIKCSNDVKDKLINYIY